jgi:hypothetical protein
MTWLLRALLAPVFLTTCPDLEVTDPPASEQAVAEDEAFRSVAERLAARTERHVAAWGTAPIADDDLAHRFAVLAPDQAGAGRGAYLIEASAGTFWLISFHVDGRTILWGLPRRRASDDTWRTIDDGAIEHAQGHARGGEELVFALRGGAPVVLRHAYKDDDADVVERKRFAVDGVCVETCPPLVGFDTEDLDLRVIGPKRTVKALVAADRD